MHSLVRPTQAMPCNYTKKEDNKRHAQKIQLKGLHTCECIYIDNFSTVFKNMAHTKPSNSSHGHLRTQDVLLSERRSILFIDYFKREVTKLVVKKNILFQFYKIVIMCKSNINDV